jgi:hypothetical protein
MGARRSAHLARLAVAVLVCASAASLAVQQQASSQTASPQLRLAGAAQTVFDWRSQACTPAMGPDLPVRAFRDYRGRTQLLLSHYENFRLVGPSLERLHRDCHAVLRSREDPSPNRFDDREWIASVFTRNGRTIWALVDEEYQGNRHRGRCPSGSYYECLYNAVTLARSNDGGRSYTHVSPPGQLLAGPPRPYQQSGEPIGVFTPSNIVPGPRGARYALVRVRDPDGTRGDCLLRAARVGSPGAWRAWQGSGFSGVLLDPYRTPASTQVTCGQVGVGVIAEMTESLTYNTVLGRYLLVGLAPPGAGSIGAKVTGIYFSTSSDLVHWTPRTLVVPAVTAQTYVCGGPSPIAYPSVIDPRSPSRTFATSGRHPYLYFTQFHYSNCHSTAERDLIRVPLEILP